MNDLGLPDCNAFLAKLHKFSNSLKSFFCAVVSLVTYPNQHHQAFLGQGLRQFRKTGMHRYTEEFVRNRGVL